MNARRTNQARVLLAILIAGALGLAVAHGMVGSSDDQPQRNRAGSPPSTNQGYGAPGHMMGGPDMMGGQGMSGPGMMGPGTMGVQGMMGRGMMGGQGAGQCMHGPGMYGPGQGMMPGQGMHGPGMMGGQGAGQGMHGPGMQHQGHGMMGGRGMMGGQGMHGQGIMGPGMMHGQGMMGPGMMGGQGAGPGMMPGQGMKGGQGMMGGMGMSGALPSNAEPLDDADLLDRLEAAADAFGQDVRVADVMPFENHTYAQFVGGDGQGLAEVLVDRYSGIVTPEPGPNMMWNRAAGMGAAMGPGMGNWMGAAPRVQDDDATARERAEAFLANYLPGAEVLSEQTFPGYVTFDYGREGRVDGMLSVNAATGAIWPHTWHGSFLGDAHD